MQSEAIFTVKREAKSSAGSEGRKVFLEVEGKNVK